ncbi:hypothetical protein [Flavobacterium sp.]|uniref:hypothetical protein n=1 Tax=Flavobacterium sp. TaxID=239 RepID=UPI00286E13CE|nr:hypothetical protein [Flavobacterium sp.]
MKKLNSLLIAFSLFFIISCTTEPYEGKSNTETIAKDSKLFRLISGVTSKSTDPLQDIVCIDFIYPFTTIIYNSNLENIGTTVLNSDEQFSLFLANFPTNQSISISYPISTTLTDGTIFTVNNNDELKLAIDSCSKEDIIAYGSSLFSGDSEEKCVWKITYTNEGNIKYFGGIFDVNSDNTLVFSFENTNYVGTWIFLFVNDELHININLEGTSEVAQDWNFNKKVELTEDTITIKTEPKTIILNKSCESNASYEISDNGPAGGIVFYDKGIYSSGWRYLEVAPTDLGISEWGCLGSNISNASNLEIGSGIRNTAAIINFHNNLQNFYSNPSICNPLNNGTVAGKEAVTFTVNGYKDWFLPSIGELELIQENLYMQNLGNLTDSSYWSSTGVDADNAKSIDFTTGNTNTVSKIPNPNLIKSRAVRYF